MGSGPERDPEVFGMVGPPFREGAFLSGDEPRTEGRFMLAAVTGVTLVRGT